MNLIKKCHIYYLMSQGNSQDLMDYLDTGCYVHFTNNPSVIGVNPRRDPINSGGPNGIYTYEWNSRLLNSGKLIFAKDRSHAALFAPLDTSTILDVAAYTEQDFERDLQKIRGSLESLMVDEPLLDKALKARDKFLGKFDSFRRTLSDNYDTPAGKLYYVIGRLISREKIDPEDPINYSDGMRLNDAALVTQILTQLGYTGFTDRYGMIYSSEPEQTVFFSMNSLRTVGVFENQLLRK